MDKKDLQEGSVYYSKRDDIVDTKFKYQIYLDDNLVLLINTDPDYLHFCLPITKEECSILKHTSYVCLNKLLEFDYKYPIKKAIELESKVLKRLHDMIELSHCLAPIHIKKIQRAIDEILRSRGY